MNRSGHISKSKGQTLVEVLVAIGLSAIMLPALATALVASREGRAQESERLQATALLRETTEAMRSVREKGWSFIATNGTYYPTLSGNAWSLASGTQTTGNFTRQIVISDVQRNSAGAIVPSGGTLDPSTKKVVTTVSWTTPIPSNVSSETYYSRYLGNNATTDSTQADFTPGTLTNTTITNNSGGEVELTSSPGATSWTSPTVLRLIDTAGTEDATDIRVDGNYAYVADTTVLRIYDISNIATGAPTALGTYTAGGTINSIAVSGNFVYLATSNTAGEFVVVNATNKSALTATVVNLANTNIGTAIFVANNHAYIGRAVSTTSGQNEFFIYDVTTPTAPIARGSLNLTAQVNSIYVPTTTHAFLATSVTTAEVTVVKIDVPTTPTSAGIYDAVGTSIGTDIFAVGNTVYLGKANNTSGAEFFMLTANTTVPTAVTFALAGSYEAGANINGVYVSGTLAFLATAITSAQFRVLDLATSPITVEGSTNLSNNANDIWLGGNYAFLASTNNLGEITVTQGSVTSGGYQTSGTFESGSFDGGASVAYNYITFTVTEPASTAIRFQIAVNDNNSTWNFVGPDGTAATFYDTAQMIRLNTLGRYMRYRASFSGPGTSTPVLQDITVNYSP